MASDSAGRHFQSLTPFQHRYRGLYHDTLRRLGASSHVVRAQGARFRVDTHDYVDRCIALFGMWEEIQLEQLARLATSRKIDVFLDVGANTGFYTVMFAVKQLAPRIIAFEPDPGNYARLMHNLELNGLTRRVEAVQLALGDASSQVKLFEGASWNRGESTIAVPEQTPQDKSHLVEQARFDDLYAMTGQSVIVKMDVEGYEFQALAGMERTLRDNQCYLQVEHYGTRHDDLKAQFAGYGYRYLHTHDIDLFFTNMPGVE